MKRGVFVLSLDLELKWGSFDHGKDLSAYHFERTREAVDRLLELLNRYDIPATFATVGHLFLQECKPVNGVKHPEIIRPQPAWWPHDWFESDPCTSREQDPDWYGDDILNRIRKATPRHEIGSHSFSHVVWGDAGTSAEVAESELKACVQAAKPWGIPLRSFVFPRNQVGHVELLAQHGFSAYRGLDPTWFNRFKGKWARAGLLLDTLFRLTPPTVLPRKTKEGLWDIPGSMIYLSRLGIRRYIPMAWQIRKAHKGLARAVQRKEVFHFWFHPFNLCVDLEVMMQGLEAVFQRIAELRRQEKIDVLTMGQLAERCERSGVEETS